MASITHPVQTAKMVIVGRLTLKDVYDVRKNRSKWVAAVD